MFYVHSGEGQNQNLLSNIHIIHYTESVAAVFKM